MGTVTPIIPVPQPRHAVSPEALTAASALSALPGGRDWARAFAASFSGNSAAEQVTAALGTLT